MSRPLESSHGSFHCYTNDLHEALLKKGTNFWKCWNSKLGDKNRLVNTVNGVTDKRKIAENFATYFSQVCTNTSAARAAELKAAYDRIRSTYIGFPTDASFRFDAELVESVICRMKLWQSCWPRRFICGTFTIL